MVLYRSRVVGIEADLTRIWVAHARFYLISKDLNELIYIFTDLAIYSQESAPANPSQNE
jgi:hypothetical protein